MKVVVRDGSKALVMYIRQVCFTQTKDVRMVLLNNCPDFWHSIYKVGTPLVPMGNLDTLSSSITIFVPRLKICDHIEEGVDEDIEAKVDVL